MAPDSRPIAIIDIETTGLDPHTNQILEFACILWDPIQDLCLGGFKRILLHTMILGHPAAIKMNARLFQVMVDSPESCISPDQLAPQFISWLRENGFEGDSITVTGKNAATFDIPFLRPVFSGSGLKFKHRVLDVGSLYYQPQEDGGELPSLQKCLDRAGIAKTVSHTALDDCEAVLELLRCFYF